MLSFEEAEARLLAGAAPLPAERVRLAEAHGRFLAEDLAARLTQPGFDASAMDGWAIRWTDMPGPWRQVGESAAGAPFAGSLGAGEAVRIFTGAVLPPGADTVVVQEDVEAAGIEVRLVRAGPPQRGAHIRRRGNDFMEGELLARAGTYLSPALLGLAAAAGHEVLNAHRRPRVAMLSTGDELVAPGAAPGPGQTVASSGPMIAALLKGAGAEVEDLGIVADDLDRLAAALARAAEADLVISIGGASVGDRDLVRAALGRAGAAVDFWRIAMKPGKPLIAGALASARVLGLPGNPVSAYVCALLFAVPLVRRLHGAPAAAKPFETAPLAAALPANGERRDHLRGLREGAHVRAFAAQDSAQMAALARADVLIVRPPHAPPAAAGDEVPIIALDRPACFP